MILCIQNTINSTESDLFTIEECLLTNEECFSIYLCLIKLLNIVVVLSFGRGIQSVGGQDVFHNKICF